ncbi:MAG: hypothetical protein NZ761_04700, partial [Dehalococcoidia bacterium]|nr:hypothetical protein [Dehalococcoidia bacterium]
RNLRLVELLHHIRQRRLEAGADVSHCIVLALPRWDENGPSGGAMMTVRFALAFGIPVRIWRPGVGWERYEG